MRTTRSARRRGTRAGCSRSRRPPRTTSSAFCTCPPTRSTSPISALRFRRTRRWSSDGRSAAGWRLGGAPLVLTVSAKRPHKNLERLFEAFSQVRHGARASARRSGLPDLPRGGAAGACGTHSESAVGSDSLGWIDDDVLDGLYRAASCFVFPSLAEGFGLPVLDALVRGTPTACSNASSLPEVGGDAVLYFDPTDTGAITQAITRLLEDAALRERLRGARSRNRPAHSRGSGLHGRPWRATADPQQQALDRTCGQRTAASGRGLLTTASRASSSSLRAIRSQARKRSVPTGQRGRSLREVVASTQHECRHQERHESRHDDRTDGPRSPADSAQGVRAQAEHDDRATQRERGDRPDHGDSEEGRHRARRPRQSAPRARRERASSKSRAARAGLPQAPQAAGSPSAGRRAPRAKARATG